MIYAQFIGVNRYQDAAIPELGGATRDALALWSIFSDSLDQIEGRLLVDEDATAEAVRLALEDSLGRAGPDDTVFISFAGHGSRDHRLVVHDTRLDHWDETSIPMSELAEEFRSSEARAVVLVLDCCFSGGAPARVFEESPRSRDVPFDENIFAGKGRVMLTASGLSEEAFEHPITRHGLLSEALVEALCGVTEPTSVASVMDKVQEKVRADAASIGRTQSPVLFGLIEGGLTLPPLSRGAKFKEHFPEPEPIEVSSEVESLAGAGIPESIVSAWGERFPAGLNELQVTAANEYGLLNGESLVTVAPTSAGKTFLGEMAAVRAIADGRKVAFLLPYKALVNEKYEDFSALYGEELGLRVIRCSGDFLDETEAFIKGKFDISVLTFEMFLSLAVGNLPSLQRLGLVVLDEAQFIADSSRGIVVELILTYFRSARSRGVDPQLLLLSATIGDLNHMDDWLDTAAFVSSERPVPLEFGVLDRSGTFEYLNAGGGRHTEQLLAPHEIVQRRSNSSSQDVIVPLVRSLLSSDEDENVMIFRNTRGASQGCANYLAESLQLEAARETVARLPELDLSEASQTLRTTLAGGAAFHNSDLTRDERIAIERAFRDPDSPVRVLVATSTVAAGVNTPASTVLIVEHQFPWQDYRFTVAEIRNMAGRAGRLGYRETGRAILLASTGLERRQLFEEYVLGEPERVRSSFDEADIGTWVLRLLAQVDAIDEDELFGVLSNTYGGYLRNRADPDWRSRTERRLEDLVPRMVDDELLEREGQTIQLTMLGQACGESSLTLESSLRLVELLGVHSDAVTADELMIIIQALAEMDDVYTPLFKRGQKETRWPQELARRFGRDLARGLQRYTRDKWTYYSRAKRALILCDWIDGLPISRIEEKYTMNPYQGSVSAGNIRGIADATRFRLRSASAIASVLLLDASIEPDEIESQLRRLEVGLPEAGLGLLELPIRLRRGEYLALIDAGVTEVTEYWELEPDKRSGILGSERTRQLEEAS